MGDTLRRRAAQGKRRTMTDIVIVAYRPLPGREAELHALAREHVPLLRELRLATEREPVLMKARDGTIVEVFEWRDAGIAAAHSHPRIAELWARYAELCTYVKLGDLAEAAEMFAGFKPLD
jgi:hypothetical protein